MGNRRRYSGASPWAAAAATITEQNYCSDIYYIYAEKDLKETQKIFFILKSLIF